MKRFIHFLLLLYSILFFSCQSETNSSPKNLIDQNNISIFHLLFFQKEQNLELWATQKNSEKILLHTFKNTVSSDTPIGIYQIQNEQGLNLQLESPNDFYDEKLSFNQMNEIFIIEKNKGKCARECITMNKSNLDKLLSYLTGKKKIQAFIFPNDLREDGKFEPCFSCPHRMAELYSSLELHLNNFKTKNQ